MPTPENSIAPEPRRRKIDLVHLQNLTATEPNTSTGRVVWIWPEIKASLAAGKQLHEVWAAACRDGLKIPYPQFRVYVSRVRRRKQAHIGQEHKLNAPSAPTKREERIPSSADPFRNLRTQGDKKQSSGFNYDPFSIQKSLID